VRGGRGGEKIRTRKQRGEFVKLKSPRKSFGEMKNEILTTNKKVPYKKEGTYHYIADELRLITQQNGGGPPN